MTTEKRTARRKRQRERRKLATERLARRQEERQHEKEVTRWLLQAGGDEAAPALLQEALAQAQGTPLESVTAELVQLAQAAGEGDDLDGALEQVSGWLDRCEAQLADLAAQAPASEATHAEDT